MQTLGNLFNIVIFISSMGSIFSFASLFAKKVFHLSLPLWFGVFELLFFLVPFIVPQVQLIPGENQLWQYGYQIASIIWLLGMIAFSVYFIVRPLFAARALNQYTVCQEERILRILNDNCTKLKIKKTPRALFTSLKDLISVVTVLHPVILLNEEVIQQLTDQDLKMILGHELVHIKRKHHFLQRLYDLASILHWFNPFVWISKNDFELICEMDCDEHTIGAYPDVTPSAYAATMLHLMELSAKHDRSALNGLEALGFLLAKQRFSAILYRPNRLWRMIALVILAASIVGTIMLSAMASRTHFYPYPALQGPTEYVDPTE